MGSNQFQKEYIEHLQKVNTDLLDRLNQMKENYECRLSKDWNRNHLIKTLEEVLNIFTVFPQEVDIFFDKISAAMGAFKNILLRKSEMLQVMEKINKALNSTVISNEIGMENSDLAKIQLSEPGENKIVGTIKESPIFSGHVILKDPVICLRRLPGVFTPSEKRETSQLSPIIEASPDESSDPSNLGLIFKEPKFPLERKYPNLKCYSYISQESPKSRFKGPKTWKKSLSSKKFQDHQRNTEFLENSESTSKKLSTDNGELPQLEKVDPQEGPSWLHEENSEVHLSSSHNVDYRRRKNRFATVFDNDEDCLPGFDTKSRISVKEDLSELQNRLSTANEEEEFKEIKNRVRESSDDFICESLSSEREENYSPLKKRHQKTKRGSRRSCDKKDIKKFSKDFEKRSLSSHSKSKSISHSPVYSDSSDKEDNENNPLTILMKDRKSFKKSPGTFLHERLSAEISFGRTPKRTEYSEQEGPINKRTKDSRENSAENDVLENEMYTELEDCVIDKKNSPQSLRTGSVIEKKKFRRSSSKSKSRSPVVILQENLGRVRRKAAPTFKLVEPHLNTKLRRN